MGFKTAFVSQTSVGQIANALNVLAATIPFGEDIKSTTVVQLGSSRFEVLVAHAPSVGAVTAQGVGTVPFLARWASNTTLENSTFQDDGIALKPNSDNLKDLGTTSLRWQHGFFAGTVSVGGTSGTARFASNTSVAMDFGGSAVGGSAVAGTVVDKLPVRINGVVRYIPLYTD